MVRQQIAFSITSICHGSELVHFKRFTVLSRPDLHKKKGTSVKYPDHYGQNKQERKNNEGTRNRQKKIEQTLLE
jgi:hypothetical protein